MLKPWVVSTLYWLYVSGLLMLVGATFALKRWNRWKPARFPVITGAVATVVGIGLMIVFVRASSELLWIVSAGCGAVVGLAPDREKTAVTIFLVSPLLLFLCVGHWVRLDVLKSQSPFYETDLPEAYVCRAYRVPADSLTKTRVTVQRRAQWGLRDEMAGTIDGYESCFICGTRGNGQVEMAIYECDGPIREEQRVVLELLRE